MSPSAAAAAKTSGPPGRQVRLARTVTSHSLHSDQHEQVTMLCIVLLVTGFVSSAKPAESSEFSENSEFEFGKSVVYGGAHENDVNSFAGDEFLRNFKSLHNETDLQALATEEHTGSGASDTMDSRADTGPRVLRGTSDHLGGLSLLEQPLFTAFKHNTIDTADFSDCALQGEWKPIGIPNEHYTHHAEDHQKEHFHALAENHNAAAQYASAPSSGIHSSLDAEGVDFWNQFVKETNNNLHLMHHDKFPKRPNHQHHTNHHHKKHHNKPPRQHQNIHYGKPPSPPNYPPKQHHPPPNYHNQVKNPQVFENIRNPHSNDIGLQFEEQPALTDDVLLQQSFLQPQHQSLDGHELTFIHTDDQASVGYPPLEQPLLPPTSLQIDLNTGDNRFKIDYSGKNQDESYLSPPPVPQHRPQTKPLDRPKSHQRPKQFEKPYRPPYKSKGGHKQFVPPPVNEYPEDHQSHVFDHHQHSSGLVQQRPSESSTFTCGHNHVEGTNYHTASYQVEGESDPTLLEHEITGANNQLAPIIVGQPIFEHDGPSGPVEVRVPKHDEAFIDQVEEGSESIDVGEGESSIGGSFSSSRAPESSTPANSLETTAPQTFRTDLQQQTASPIPAPPANLFTADSNPSASSSFDVGFDHSGFSSANIHTSHKQSTDGSENTFNFAQDPEFQKLRENSHSLFGQQEQNSFFSTRFGPSFSKGPSRGTGSLPSGSPPTSFTEFSHPPFQSKPFNGPNPGKIAVFDHTPKKPVKPLQPRKKIPQKHYQVNEDSGERIPLSAIFPPTKQVPQQFDMRMPNFANPNAKRPKQPLLPSKPPQSNKFKSSVHFDGSNIGVYSSHPRNKVTKIRLKMKNRPNSPTGGPLRFSEPDFRKGLTVMARGH